MRAIICSAFSAYTFEKVEGLCADEFAELAGAALWLRDEEAKAAKAIKKKGKRR